MKPIIKLPPRSKSISVPEIVSKNELYFQDPDNEISDFDIQRLLKDYNLLQIKRERGGGYLSFPDSKIGEKVYCLFNGYMFSNQTTFKITLTEDVKIDGPILEVRHLPINIDRNQLYDIFRPYGPLNICQPIADNGSSRGRALVQYFFKESSEQAHMDLNGKLYEGNIIQITTIVMNGNLISRYPFNKPASPLSETKESGGFIDYTNLYVKNLDPTVDNNDLFTIFRKFGRIVSARIMTNPQNGQSKGYGFVSFSKPEEAAAARDEMNGIQVRTKPMIVAFHEPKKPRQEKSSSTTTSSFHSPPPSAPIEYATTPYFETRHPHEMINGHSFDHMEHLGSIKEIPTPVPKKSSENTFNPPPIRTSPQFNSRPSLASLASGVTIQPAPKIQEELRSLRRKGSLESVNSVMTESSARLQRQRMSQAVKRCGDYGDNFSDLVDMLLTLKRKERSICLFNPDFLKDKIVAALDALEICEDDEEPEAKQPVKKKHRNVQIDAKASPPLPLPTPSHHFIENVIIPPRVSKAIPIVAPPSESPEIKSLLKSLEGKHLHEQKQLLGDQLFPLVKATGVKGAPKITICLLDTIELETLAKLMFQRDRLRTQIDKVIATF